MSVSCKTMAQAVQEMKAVCDCTENGKCSGCGSCCGRLLPLMDSDIERIRKYLRKNPHIKPHELHLPLAESRWTLNMMCPFLDQAAGKHKCMIYEARPAICREYMCKRDMENRYLVHLVKTFRREPKIYDMWKEFFGRADLPEELYPVLLGE